MPLLYRVLAWAGVAVALVGFGYVRGLVADQAADEARMAAWTQESVRVIKVQGEVTERVVTEYRDRIKVVTKEVEKIKHEIVRVPTGTDCALSNEWVRLHNAAAGYLDSQAAGRTDGAAAGIAADQALPAIADNYAACRANAEQLIALQEWAREQAAIGGEHAQAEKAE